MSNLVMYTAGSIDLSKDAPGWRTLLMRKLEENELVSAVLFDPSTAYKHAAYGKATNLARSKYIEEINRQALEQSNVFVMCLLKGQPSIGTPIELDYAYGAGKHIYLITDITPGQSVYLDNRVPVDNWFYISDMSNLLEFDKILGNLATILADKFNGHK